MFLIQRFNPLFPNIKEHILYMMGNGGNRIKLHHGGRALDGVHDTEDFIYVI